MRNPDRIPNILYALGKYWAKHPDLRLGQIISNANSTHRARQGLTPDNDVFYLEDDDLLPILYEEIE